MITLQIIFDWGIRFRKLFIHNVMSIVSLNVCNNLTVHVKYGITEDGITLRHDAMQT